MPKGTEITALAEWDNEAMGALGFFAKGHWDRKSFAIAANQEFGLEWEGKPVCASKVRHGFHSAVCCGDGGPKDCLKFRSQRSSGSWPVTIFEY